MSEPVAVAVEEAQRFLDQRADLRVTQTTFTLTTVEPAVEALGKQPGDIVYAPGAGADYTLGVVLADGSIYSAP